MNDQTPEVTETIETPAELTEQDQADLQRLFSEPDGGPGATPPSYHTILEVWREILTPAIEEATKKPTPQWCTKIAGQYFGVGFEDMVDYRDQYFGLIIELLEQVKAEIATDPECLTYTTPEEDCEHNRQHYINLLTSWQQTFLQRELEWDCLSKTAAVDMAVLSEVHKMMFGQTGITQYLDNIRLEYTEADQEELAAVLTEQRDSYSE